jgi:hypothetical protein
MSIGVASDPMIGASTFNACTIVTVRNNPNTAMNDADRKN